MTTRELIKLLMEYDEEIQDQKVYISIEGSSGCLLQIDNVYLDGSMVGLSARWMTAGKPVPIYK